MHFSNNKVTALVMDLCNCAGRWNQKLLLYYYYFLLIYHAFEGWKFIQWEECLSKLLILLLQLEFGVVYSCIEDKMYTARKGKGAFCNGQPLQVSDQKGERSSWACWSSCVKCLFVGSHLNSLQLFPNHITEINQSIIATEFGSNRDPDSIDKIFSSMRKILCLPVHGYVAGFFHTQLIETDLPLNLIWYNTMYFAIIL